MIDFHTHILPNIDDGAKTVDDSLFLLDTVSKLGMSQVVLSPHYYPSQERISEFVSKRNESCKALANAVKSAQESGKKFPQLHVAAEVYLEPIIFNNDDLTPLTLDSKGKFMLTELLYEDELTHSTESMVRQLVYSYNIVPILAHVDRYPFLMKEKNLLRLLDMGCVAQMNVSSLSGFFQRKKLLKYVEKGYIGVIGTDIHNKTYISRIKEGFSYLREDDLEYVTNVSRGILKKSKKDSSNESRDIVAD